MNKLTLLVLALAMVQTITTLPASAGEEIITKSQVVRFGDLNLSSDQGIRTLYQRIRTAARKVCSQANDTMVLEHRNFRGCVNKAVDEAVDKVNRPALTAMHRTRTPHPAG
jgi:UrcA family protein